MMMDLLVREPGEVSQRSDELINFDQLAIEAKHLLGYTVLERSLGLERAQLPLQTEQRNPLPLRKGMDKLGIKPFIPETVEAYKQKVTKDATRRASLRCLGNFWPICAVMTLVVSSLALSASNEATSFFCWSFTSIVAAMSCALFFLKRSVRDVPNVWARIGWSSFFLHDYQKPVPEYVLQTAVDLKKICPQAEFYVEEFSFNDPLLVVGDYTYSYFYIEVWGEAQFQGERVK